MVDEDDSKDAATLAAMARWIPAIAHNLNNPLGGIGAAMEILNRQINSSPGTLDVDLANDAIYRIKDRLSLLQSYVHELVNFAKPPSINKRVIAVRTLIAMLEGDPRGRFPLGYRFISEVAVDQFNGDAEKLMLILQALVTNGFEASAREDGQPTVLLRVARVDEGCSFEVHDNGPGFERRSIVRAFEPFFSTKEAGTGLGLSLVKKYAVAHGGTVSMGNSKRLGGALVQITIPD